MVMDDIFGKQNFVTQFVWNTEGHTDNQFHVKINHEYIVMYAARESDLNIGYVVDPNTRGESNLWAGFAENSITKNGPANPPSEIELPIGFPVKPQSLDLSASDIPDGLMTAMQERGLTSNQLKAEFGRIRFPLRLDRMKADNHCLTQSCRVFSGWANANKLRDFIAGNCEPMKDDDDLLIKFYLSENGVIYYRKDRGNLARNIVSVLRNLSTTEKMRSELESMGLHFGYPKPKELIKYILTIGSNVEDLVLDSFAGSGTTAQAILELNAEGANRRFILVELEPKIAREITAQRTRKVAEGYRRTDGVEVQAVGGGFRFCELGEPLFNEGGKIRDTVSFADLARHVYFSETGEPLPRECITRTPFLGVCRGVGIYLLYNGILRDKSANGGNVLTRAVLAQLPPFDGQKVIYCAGCLLGRDRLQAERIVVRQIPYEVKVS
jgi:hypothetical protein